MEMICQFEVKMNRNYLSFLLKSGRSSMWILEMLWASSLSFSVLYPHVPAPSESYFKLTKDEMINHHRIGQGKTTIPRYKFHRSNAGSLITFFRVARRSSTKLSEANCMGTEFWGRDLALIFPKCEENKHNCCCYIITLSTKKRNHNWIWTLFHELKVFKDLVM